MTSSQDETFSRSRYDWVLQIDISMFRRFDAGVQTLHLAAGSLTSPSSSLWLMPRRPLLMKVLLASFEPRRDRSRPADASFESQLDTRAAGSSRASQSGPEDATSRRSTPAPSIHQAVMARVALSFAGVGAENLTGSRDHFHDVALQGNHPMAILREGCGVAGVDAIVLLELGDQLAFGDLTDPNHLVCPRW
jgi:hypothetical protein